MKPRTVVVEVEFETSMTIRDIKEVFKRDMLRSWPGSASGREAEIRVNVIRPTKPRRNGARKGRR